MTAEEKGARLDKLPCPAGWDRVAVPATALERNKVQVNGADATIGTPVSGCPPATSCVWMDRPGSAKRPLGGIDGIDGNDLRIVYEDDVMLVLNKPRRACWRCR